MEEVLKFLQDAGTFYIATDDGGQPRVRPFGAAAIIGGKLYFCTNNKKPVWKQLLANPKTEISATAKDGSWIRIAGEAVQDDSDASRQAMLDAIPMLKGMYHVGDGVYEVFYLKNVAAKIESFAAPPKEYKF
ncbi:MAG: pyridoxamine 5'-phosphate oxidase family protein [Oscillospiraceae bacterium]|jgi:uncharacterized pyridoxamine 5'-phosphate oxidase family protein|nr:pyridoxamine 5'-phosphate oxidase family protein [Oscillospiraceae bacterium]